MWTLLRHVRSATVSMESSLSRLVKDSLLEKVDGLARKSDCSVLVNLPGNKVDMLILIGSDWSKIMNSLIMRTSRCALGLGLLIASVTQGEEVGQIEKEIKQHCSN